MKIQIIEGLPKIDWRSERDREICTHCAVSGRVWGGYIDGELEACWGVIPPSFMSDIAYIWMLDLEPRHPLILARHSRKVIKGLLERWELNGHCALGSGSFKWLRFLGATFDEPQGRLVPFVIRRA